MPTQRYSIVARKMIGIVTYAIIDSESGRFITGAHTRQVASEKCKSLNSKEEKRLKSLAAATLSAD